VSAPTPATRAQVRALARLQRADERRARGACLVEGARLVAEALEAGCVVEQVATDGREDAPARAVLERVRARGVPVVALAPREAARIAAREHGPGFFARVRRPAPWDGAVPPRGPVLVVVACGLQDPGNVGALARSARAFGACGAWLVGSCADPFGPKVVRASAGAVFRLPLAGAPLEAVLERAGADGLEACAAVAPRGREDAGEGAGPAPLALPARCALLLGHETRGVPAAAGARPVTIPQRPDVESLNVAAAGAVLAAAWFGAWGEA